MFTEICQYLRNWFEVSKYFGEFVISDGVITYSNGSALPLLDNQYFRIVGSIFNDGVHKCTDTQDVLANETFSGSVWSMAIPPVVISLATDIDNWVKANSDAINSPYQSESFGGYSYSLGGNSRDGSSAGATWQMQFASRLAPWRKI